jgi:hypothetical protein
MNNFSKVVLGSVAAVAVSASAAFATIPAQTNCSYYFANNMKLGMRSADIMNLQKVLNMDVRTQVAASGVGSAGQETNYFGAATFAAVKKFQSLNGVSPVSGYAATLTRGVLNQICATGGTTTTPVSTSTSNVNVNGLNIASSNIPVGVLVAGQASAKMADFVVNGNGTVTSLELMRVGISNNSTLKNVYLYDGATRITDAASVLNDGTIRFSNSMGLFNVSGSKTITVRADLDSASAGQTVGVAMKSVTLMGQAPAMITGVTGPLFSVASANVATVSFSGANTVPAASVNAGQQNYNIWGASMSVGTRAVRLQNATFRMIGSAPQNALSNVRLIVDGVQVGTASINAAGYFVFNMSAAPVVLNTGGHTVELRADIVNGANRNFYMSLENVADFMVEDSTLPGVFVAPTNFNNVMNAGTITINTGNLTISQDPAFTTTNVVGGATNVTIGKFVVRTYGEDLKIQTLAINPVLSGTTPAAAGLNNVTLYVNGGQVGTSANWTSGTLTYNLGSQFIVTAGTPVTLEVRADMVTTGNVTYTAGTVRADVVSTTNGAQGMSSYNLVTVPAQSGKTLTINGSSPVFAKSSGFVSQSVAPNSRVKIGSFILQNGAVEDLTVNNVLVNISGSMALTNVSNLTVMDGSTAVGQTMGTVANANNISTSGIVVPKSSTKTFDVYADLGSASSGTVQADMGITYRGNTSFMVTTVPAVTGVITTVGTATLSATTTSATNDELAQYVTGGTVKKIVTYKVTSTNNVPATVQRLVFAVSAADSIQSVTVGSTTAAVAGGVADVTGLSIAVPGTPAGVTIPVTVTYSCFVGGNTGSGCNLTNSPVTPRTALVTLNTVEAMSGSTLITLSPAAASQSMSLVASKPSLSVNSTNASGLVNAEVKIGEVTVTADAGGDIQVTQIPFNVSVNAATAPTLSACRIADGSTTVAGSSVSACAAGAVNAIFGSAQTIAAGTSKTYSLYATVGGMTGAAGTVSISTNVNTPASFLWNDVIGGGTAPTLNGSLVNNYPTASYSIHN